MLYAMFLSNWGGPETDKNGITKNGKNKKKQACNN